MSSGKSGHRLHGFTLVEVIVFIVIAGVAAYALFMSFSGVMPRAPTQTQLVQAAHLAQERVELILGQRQVAGYNAAQLDPCKIGAPAICTNTLGYSVSSLGTGAPASPDPPVQWNGNPTANFKLVTVTVQLNTTTLATQNVVLANY